MKNEEKKENEKEINGFRFLLFGGLFGVWVGMVSNLLFNFLFLEITSYLDIFFKCLLVFLPAMLFVVYVDDILEDLGYKPSPVDNTPFMKKVKTFFLFFWKHKKTLAIAIAFSAGTAHIIYIKTIGITEDNQTTPQEFTMELHPPERFRGPVTKV